MKFLATLFALLALTTAPTIAQEGKSLEELDGDEMLRLVRYSYTLYDRDFSCQLRKGFKTKIPFTLSLQPQYIRFKFSDPAQIIHLNTAGNQFFLKEVTAGSDAPVPPEKYGQRIRGTDVTYDDLSMRFLYWPDAKILKEEKVKSRKCWMVRVTNPDDKGIYGTVDIYIDQGSGGMMKMVGWDKLGRPIRRFEVLHGKKMVDIWMVDEMRVQTIDPDTKKPVSHTYMEILDIEKSAR